MAARTVPIANEWLEDYVLQFVKSRSWADPIESFIEDKCSIFDVSNQEENKLEYTIVHNEFKEIVESLLVAHLLDVDVSPEAFAAAFESNALAAKADSRLGVVVSQIISVGDFMVFKQMMIARHLSQQRAISDGQVPSNDASTQEELRHRTCDALVQSEQELRSRACEALLQATHERLAQVTSTAVTNVQAIQAPSFSRANRIASIIQNAGKEKANNSEKAEMVRAALAVSAGRMKAMQRAGA